MRHSGKDGRLDAASIIEKAADLLLKRLDGGSIKGSGRVGRGLVEWSTVGGWDIDGWGCGRGAVGNIETGDDLIDVSRHEPSCQIGW